MLASCADAGLAVLGEANWWWTSGTYGARFSMIRTFVNTFLNTDGTPFTDRAGYETMEFLSLIHICTFGGVEIYLPSDWNLLTQIDAFIGGCDDKRYNSSVEIDKEHILIVRGKVSFGGIEFKS